MKDTHIKYIEGVKYWLQEDYHFKTKIVGHTINTDFSSLDPEGNAVLKKGFACDGPSGPTVDTPDFMRGAFEHDIKYEWMRQGLIPQDWRYTADFELRETCLEDGMPKARADIVFRAVDAFAGFAADPKNIREILVAPRPEDPDIDEHDFMGA